MVQIIITLLGLITVLAGVLPFIGNFVNLPAAVIGGVGYSLLISVIGILGMLYGFISISLIGETKFVMISLGLITLLGGIIPFVSNLIPPGIPTSGPIYSGVIILIGVIGFFYGLRNF